MYRLCTLLSLLAVIPASLARNKGASSPQSLKKEDCEVCLVVLRKFTNLLTEKSKSDSKLIKDEFRKYCRTSRNLENRFCYYLGGVEESATSILSEISKPLSNFVPIEKICAHLKKIDAQICDLHYEKGIDLETFDLKKLKVRDLKDILSDWGKSCDGCTEKSDFISRIAEIEASMRKE